MPPRVRLTEDEASRLPALLAATREQDAHFPREASAEAQVAWVAETYRANDQPLTVSLLTLLLFEHGVHRSAETVGRQLAGARAAGLISPD